MKNSDNLVWLEESKVWFDEELYKTRGIKMWWASKEAYEEYIKVSEKINEELMRKFMWGK